VTARETPPSAGPASTDPAGTPAARRRRTGPSKAKRGFDVAEVFRRLRRAVRPFPKAAMFALADEGYTSAFEQLVACVLSIRTTDEVMLVTARRLFAVARTPADVGALSHGELDRLIGTTAFHAAKAAQILEMARELVARHGGTLPCDEALMLGFRGVGPKCTNLVLGIACGQKRIGVDVHVHRVTNRWGYVAAPTPEATMVALEAKLPKRYHVEINRLLVPFGKHICTGRRPKCSTCPVLDYCQQVGVTEHR
jgi:endonuclease III